MDFIPANDASEASSDSVEELAQGLPSPSASSQASCEEHSAKAQSPSKQFSDNSSVAENNRPSTPQPRSAVLTEGDLFKPPSSVGSKARADISPPPSASATTSPSFRGSKICVAVDVSGSTYGTVLAAEQRAIQSICKLIPRNLRPTISIVPWTHQCGRPITLEEIAFLDSDGGTDPSVILHNPDARDSLQSADFWFLMTDGEIEEHKVKQFARGLREYEVHGKACIICVFGEVVTKPADCNVTVGVSIFAGSPHAVFLFHDVMTDVTYVLQTKGCFRALLGHGQQAPALDYETTWDDLPKTSFENLSRVHVPQTEAFGKDDVVLHDNSRFDMTAFLRDLPDDEKTIGQILDNEENMNTIAIEAKIRNAAPRLREWLDRVDAKDAISSGHAALQTSSDQLHSQLVADALDRLATEPAPGLSNCSAPRSGVPLVDMTLLSSIPHIGASSMPETPPRTIFETHRDEHRRQSSVAMRHVSMGSLETAGENLRRSSNHASSNTPFLPIEPVPSAPAAIIRHVPGPRTMTGFAKPVMKDDVLRGFCLQCNKPDEPLGLLLHEPNTSVATRYFPLPGRFALTRFPLALGNYAETDIISDEIFCMECASRALSKSVPRAGAISTVLPLISFSANRLAWVESIGKATAHRFDQTHGLLVFVGVLFTKMERLVQSGADAQPTLYKALEWTGNALLAGIVLQPTDAQINRLGPGTLDEVLLRNFERTLSDPTYVTLLEYPLDGFIAANAAISNSRYRDKMSGSNRRKIVFLRFLYHTTESVWSYRAQNGEMMADAARIITLTPDAAQPSSSLFKWDKIRKLSFRAGNAGDLRRLFTRSQTYKLALTIPELLETPFLTDEALRSFHRLGRLFDWIPNQTAHAIAIFVHQLFRLDLGRMMVEEAFVALRKMDAIRDMLEDPADLSAREVDNFIKRGQSRG